MKRKYLIEWVENNKYLPMPRQTIINLSNPSGNVSEDGKRAIDIFMSYNGSLKKNKILKIKELDEKGKQIGEDIIPSN